MIEKWFAWVLGAGEKVKVFVEKESDEAAILYQESPALKTKF